MAFAAVLRGLDLAGANALAGLGMRLDGLMLLVSTTTATTITGGRCGAG